MESDGEGYFVSGGEESSGDFACLPDDPEDGGEELDFYAEGTTEKWTPQEASARMKGFIKDYKSVHGERSLGHIDQVTRNVIQLALNPYLFLNKKERQIWGVRPKHSMILTINTNSFFELPDKLELKLGQTNLNFFLLDEVGGYQSPLNSLLSRRIIEDLYQYLKNYTSSESWRKTLNQASETDDGYPSNVLIHITDHFVRKCTEILNPAHCVICGFIAPNHTGHNITVNGVAMGPGIQAEKINRSPPVPQVLHPNCWNKFYDWFNPYEVIDNYPNVADTILFLIHAMQTYNIFQGTITLPSYIPEHLKTNNQFALTQDAYGNYQVPWTYAPQRVALFPEVSKLNPKVFGQSEIPPDNQRNQYGYHNNRYHQNLMELDRALLSNFMYLPCTLVEDEKTFHKHIQTQYSICCNSKDELRVFARKKAEMGSYLAFMQLDFSANFQVRYGIHDIPNPWINPTRGIHLAKDTEKFKPTVPHAHNPYGMQMWPNTKNKVKPGFWKMNNNVQQNPFGVTYGAYNVPFFLCEVLNNPEFQNEEDDAKKGWILCKSRDDVIPLFLVFLNDNLKIEDIEVNTMNIIESQQWEERINGLWDVVRWLVMGSSSLTWVIEYHSVLQGLPIDLILTVCTTMINSGLV